MPTKNTLKEWFTASELCGVYGLPRYRSNISCKATKERWHKRQRSGCRGAAFEYHITSLPEQAQLALRQSGTTPDILVLPTMLWTMPDNSMSPTVKKGEQVTFSYPLSDNENGLYLVVVDGEIKLRRVQIIKHGLQYIVSCDNLTNSTLCNGNITILAKVTGGLMPARHPNKPLD